MANDLLDQLVVHQELARRAREAAAWRKARLAAAIGDGPAPLAAPPWAARLRSVLGRALFKGRLGRQPAAAGCDRRCACCTLHSTG